MKVLTRYLLRAHVGPLLFAFLALTGVVLINTLAKELTNLAGKGLPTRVFVEFFILSLPANIALTLPMSVLVAVLYSFSRFAEENEITALKAGGVDLRRMVLPLLLIAAVIAGGMVMFNDRVLPAANYRWRLLMMDVAQTSPLLLLREQILNPITTADGSTDYYLRASRIDPATSRLEDVTIYDISDPDLSRTITADSGRMALTQSQTDLVLTLFDGEIREAGGRMSQEPGSFHQIEFGRQVLRITGVSQRLERTTESSFRTDRDKTIGMMKADIDTLRAELVELREKAIAEAMAEEEASGSALIPSAVAAPVEVNIRGEDIPFDEARARSLRYQIRELQVEVHKKYSIAAATLVFVLIGVPLALRFPRGGIGMVIAMSLTIFSIYYIGLIGGESLADEGYVPPEIAMWQTNIIFGGLGLFGLWHVGREHSSGRSGGWGDLPRWLRPSRWRFRRKRA